MTALEILIKHYKNIQVDSKGQPAHLREDIIPAMEEYAQEKIKNSIIGNVINWAFFPGQTPNYGDKIILRYPPESKRESIITIYDINTDWLDGCGYAVIKPCL